MPKLCKERTRCQRCADYTALPTTRPYPANDYGMCGKGRHSEGVGAVWRDAICDHYRPNQECCGAPMLAVVDMRNLPMVLGYHCPYCGKSKMHE